MKAFNVMRSLPRHAASFAVLLLAFGLFALPAQAQRRGMSEEERAERFEQMMLEMTEAVDLDAAQADTVRQLLSEEREAMRELRRERRADRTQDRREARREMRRQQAELHDTYMARIEEVLTDEQVESYRAFMKEQREERGSRRGGRRGRDGGF